MKGKRSNNFGKSKTFMISIIVIIILWIIGTYFAFKWFKKAADQGDEQAQNMLKRLNSSKIEIEAIDTEMKKLMNKVQKRKESEDI